MLEYKELMFWVLIIFCLLGWILTVIDSLIHEPFTWQVFRVVHNDVPKKFAKKDTKRKCGIPEISGKCQKFKK